MKKIKIKSNCFYLWFLTVGLLTLVGVNCFLIFPQNVLAETINQCEANKEVFGFKLSDYPMEHQGWAMLNLSIDYRLDNTSPSTIEPDIYPDFVPIAEKIDSFMKDYPNETDYWEILNKKLAQYLLDEYPTISSIKIRLDINPTLMHNYYRHSIITMTRNHSCTL